MRSVDKRGCIKLKEYTDDEGEHRIPLSLYNTVLPDEWYNPLTFFYETAISHPTGDVSDIVRFIMQMYAIWAYTMNFLKPGARLRITDIEPIKDHTQAFTLNAFLRQVVSMRHNLSSALVQISTQSLSPQSLVETILNNPLTSFAQVLRLSLEASRLPTLRLPTGTIAHVAIAHELLLPTLLRPPAPPSKNLT